MEKSMRSTPADFSSSRYKYYDSLGVDSDLVDVFEFNNLNKIGHNSLFMYNS